MTAFFPHPFFLATAAGHGEQRATIFFAQILLLVAVGRLLGEWMQRIGQPAVIGQLLAGIVLGPSVFGTIWPSGQQALFMPIFFGVAGLAIDLKVLSDPHLLGLALIVIGIASIGKLGGCYLGSRLARLNHPEALARRLSANSSAPSRSLSIAESAMLLLRLAWKRF